jgi:hypothetical protein
VLRSKLVFISRTADNTAMRVTFLLLAASAMMVPTLPASAQQTERVLTIFGEDRCPADTICVRAPERDRYRIPKELRPPSTSPENQSWAVRQEAAQDAGRSGIGSCSAVGSGGWTGCYLQQVRQAKKEREQAAAADRKVP